MKRSIISRLKQWKDHQERKPLILRGARQVGKTYILLEFGKKFFRTVHYVNFEKNEQLGQIFAKDLDPQRILQELSFVLEQPLDQSQDLIIFDEIQQAPRALSSLKYFQEECPQLAICAAGSLLGVHLGEASFPVGKVTFLDLFPMSFEEFLLAVDDTRSYDFLTGLKAGDAIAEVVHEHLWQQFKIYLVVGGLPEAVKTFVGGQGDLWTALEQVREKQEQLIITYQADMAKHSGKQNAMHIERFWRHVPAQLARQQDGSAARFRFKGVIPGAGRYSQLVNLIDWLQAAGLIIKAPVISCAQLPFSAYRTENRFKLYVFDVGILGALSQLPAQSIMAYDYGTYKGYFAENFVAQEFLYSGVKELYSWRGRTSEIEFVREVDGCVYPVEVKSGGVTRSRSLYAFAQKYPDAYRVVMSANNLLWDQHHRMDRYPLYLAYRFPLSGSKEGDVE